MAVPTRPGATGNVATEEVVHMLHDMGIDTGIDLASLIEVARMAQDHGRPRAAQRRAAGRPAGAVISFVMLLIEL